MAKDLFSEQAKLYSLYRPFYPDSLFQYIFSFVKEKEVAWDCATGNGQTAVPLAHQFKKVYASDISKKQLDEAPQKENIEYILCAAEETPFPENTFDLITVSQAYHWLDGQKFQEEATRVGKKDCVVAVWMYDLIQSGDKKLNELIRHFYKNITGPYWDAERKHVDTHYTNVLFDFAPLPGKEFLVETHLTKDQLLGYFSTWSATQNFIKANGYPPIEHIKEDLIHLWAGEHSRPFYFPIVLKMGKVNK